MIGASADRFSCLFQNEVCVHFWDDVEAGFLSESARLAPGSVYMVYFWRGFKNQRHLKGCWFGRAFSLCSSAAAVESTFANLKICSDNGVDDGSISCKYIIYFLCWSSVWWFYQNRKFIRTFVSAIQMSQSYIPFWVIRLLRTLCQRSMGYIHCCEELNSSVHKNELNWKKIGSVRLLCPAAGISSPNPWTAQFWFKLVLLPR